MVNEDSILIRALPKRANHMVVILAGGQGTRFWPRSRVNKPKQYLSLAPGQPSLLQMTALRVKTLVKPEEILVVTAKSQVPQVRAQLPNAVILAEPEGRNTAASIGLAASFIYDALGDIPTVFLPADHIVGNDSAFCQTLDKARRICVERDVLVTLGIAPTMPETGFGYIEQGEKQSEPGAFLVKRFVEKPDRKTAESYLMSGKYFWNSGMFIWRTGTILRAINEHLPELSQTLKDIGNYWRRNDEESIRTSFLSLRSISIDYGVMERAKNVIVLSGADFTWSDVGSWHAWSELLEKDFADQRGNVSQGDSFLYNTESCTIIGEKRLVAVLGIKDTIVVDSDDALLICHKSATQDVKKVVEHLQTKKRLDLL